MDMDMSKIRSNRNKSDSSFHSTPALHLLKEPNRNRSHAFLPYSSDHPAHVGTLVITVSAAAVNYKST